MNNTSCRSGRNLFGFLVGSILFSALLSMPAWSKEFTITTANASFDETELLVDAKFDLQLSDAIDEALQNGIDVRLTTTLDLFKQKRFRLDSRIARWTFNYDIQYHSLTSSYTLKSTQKDESQSFASLLELFNDIEMFHFESDIDTKSLPTSKQGYKLRLGIALDKKTLPAPLRVMTYILPKWRLKSDIHEWLIDG